MNVNSISSTSCKANPLANAKKVSIPLKDGKEAVVRFNDKAYECLITKDGKLVGGRGQYAANGLNIQECAKFFDKLSKNVKEGFDFLGEFTKAVFTK